jgi:hypothetical protein
MSHLWWTLHVNILMTVLRCDRARLSLHFVPQLFVSDPEEDRNKAKYITKYHYKFMSSM